jgi:tetratricopeptide (TPR) repeat protein
MKTFFKKNCLFCLVVVFFMGCMPAIDRKQDSDTSIVPPPFDAAAYHYSLSLHLSFNGKLDEAIGELEKALDLDPKSVFLATELSVLYSEKGHIDQAISLSEKIAAENDGDPDAHLLLAGLYLNAKDQNSALREYLRVSELDPRNIDSHLYAGILYGELKNYAKALSSLKTLLGIDPENFMGNYYTARVLTEMKQYGEAEELYKKTLSIRPLFEQAIIDLGQLYQKQGKNAVAVELYRNFIKLNPQSLNVRLKLAGLLVTLKRSEEADKELQESLNLAKGNRNVSYTIGIFYMENNQFDRAAEIFASFLKSYPKEYKIRYLLATAYEEKKEYEAAIAELNKIPQDSELYPNAQVGISMILKKRGMLDEAITNLITAIQNKKDASEFYVFLASLYEEKKEPLKAEETLKAGLQVSPSPQLHYSLGLLYEKTDRFDASIEEMRRVLGLDAKNADAMNFIGYSYADKGINLQEAEDLIKQALALKPGSGYMLDSLGWLYFRQNKIEQAIQCLEEANSILPGDPTIVEHLGDAYAKSGKTEESIKAYRQALKLNPGNKALQDKMDKLNIK